MLVEPLRPRAKGRDGQISVPLSAKSVGAVGTVVSTVKVFTERILLTFPTLSVSVIVQLLYDQVESVLKVIVVFPALAVLVVEVQLQL